MLIQFPFRLTATAVVFDVIYLARGGEAMAAVAYWMVNDYEAQQAREPGGHGARSAPTLIHEGARQSRQRKREDEERAEGPG